MVPNRNCVRKSLCSDLVLEITSLKGLALGVGAVKQWQKDLRKSSRKNKVFRDYGIENQTKV